MIETDGPGHTAREKSNKHSFVFITSISLFIDLRSLFRLCCGNSRLSLLTQLGHLLRQFA